MSYGDKAWLRRRWGGPTASDLYGDQGRLHDDEFFLTVVAILAILIATYVDDTDLGANEGWKYATWVAVAYILSRGLAKLGTREPYSER